LNRNLPFDHSKAGMTVVKLSGIAVTLVVCASSLAGQDSSFPDLSSFTKSATEHIINQIDKPFEVKSVKGTISMERSDNRLAGVLFEIEGPGSDRRIRHALSDKHGHFRIPHVPKGTYRFKATLNGFQSVIGMIVVSKPRTKASEINIQMRLGV
jgi:carboxypeptidase family protein